jgi:hypothetical protein
MIIGQQSGSCIRVHNCSFTTLYVYENIYYNRSMHNVIITHAGAKIFKKFHLKK